VKGLPPKSYLAPALSHRTPHYRHDRSVMQSKSAARKEILEEASEVFILSFCFVCARMLSQQV